MFGGENRSKKELKVIDNILRTIMTSRKEKEKNAACLKLIEIFENSLDVIINFDTLLSAIEDLAECENLQCKKIWIQLAMQIIKFRADYRDKVFIKMIKIVFELRNEDIALKIKAIYSATNCCLNIQGLDVKILIEFLTFECLMVEEYQKDNVIVMILNLLKNEYSKISKLLIEFITDSVALICLKRFSVIRDHREGSQIEEEKKYIKNLFQFFEYYFMSMVIAKRSSIMENIVMVMCFFSNYEREYTWKLMKNFLKTLSDDIVMFLLDIIYNEKIHNVFSGFEDYFYYDSDEDFGLPSYYDKLDFFQNAYKNFITKIGDPNAMLVKHRTKIITGALFLIGMMIWGHERVDNIFLPNTIILHHFAKVINNPHRKIAQEIILCFTRLVKKYGGNLSDEWGEIFHILTTLVSRDKLHFTENTMKNLYDTLDAIKTLIIANKFYGNVQLFSNLLEEFKIFNNETQLMMKSKLKLTNSYAFISNLESVIIENLVNCKSDRIRNHIMEIIRLNYSYCYSNSKSQSLRKSVIENLILKYFSQAYFSIDSAESMNYFSFVITDMLTYTNDLKFFEKIVKMLFAIHNEYKFYANELDKSKQVSNFQKNFLISLYHKLNSTYQPEKIVVLNKKIYQFTKSKPDMGLMLTLLSFFKSFTINKDYELFIGETLCYKNNNLPSQVVINFKFTKGTKVKKNYEDYTKKISIYEPYTMFKHNKIYDFLINIISNEESNTVICEEILEFLSKSLKTMYFFKSVKLAKLLNVIVNINDLKKYSARKRFVDLLIDILINSTFHLSNGMLGVCTGIVHNLAITKSMNTTTVLDIRDEVLKEKVVGFALNSLKSFVSVMKLMVGNYRRIVTNIQNNINITSQSGIGPKSTEREFRESFTLGGGGIVQGIGVNSNNPLIAVNINQITEFLNISPSHGGSSQAAFHYSYTSIPQPQASFTQGSTAPLTSNSPSMLNVKMTVYYIRRLVNLIQLYLISLVGNPSACGINNATTLNGFYFPNTAQQGYINTTANQNPGIRKLKEIVGTLIEILFEMRNLINFKLSLAVSILKLLFSIKELIFQLGDEMIVKVIYLILTIGWWIYEPEIYKLFSENFNIKFRKFDAEKFRPVEKHMKREYVNLLSDICCFYFVEKSTYGRALFSIFSQIFKCQKSQRECLFLDLCKWCVHSKTTRDNLQGMYRARIAPHSQIYLGKQSLIMIVPKDNFTSEVIIRNPISNINITIKSNLENYLSGHEDLVDALRGLINKEDTSNRKEVRTTLENIRVGRTSFGSDDDLIDSLNMSENNFIEEKGKPDEMKINGKNQSLPTINPISICPEIDVPILQINNSNIIFQQLINLISDTDFKFQFIEQSSQLEDYIKSLDNTPVYFTFSCGIIYVPNKMNISEFDLFTYDSAVSYGYLQFISSLGKLFSIVENQNVYIGGLDRSGVNGGYAIYYQDNLFQMIFHVMNLIQMPLGEQYKSKLEDRDQMQQLHSLRKRVLGNDYVNIIWLDNPYKDFDPCIIVSGVIMIYIVIYPISDTHFSIKLKYNNKSKFNLQEKVSSYFIEECCISIENNYTIISNYLVKLALSLNLMINYFIQKNRLQKLEAERNDPYFSSNNLLQNKGTNITFETNITQRHKELERIHNRFKNSI